MTSTPGFVFDFDGTLHDSVYQHVIAWQRAFVDIGLDVSLWRVHRRIGMSGSLVATRVAAETGHRLTDADTQKVEELHTRYYADSRDAVRPLPGARELLLALGEADVPWLIATSGAADEALPLLAKLDLGKQASLTIADTYETELMGVLLDASRRAQINLERNRLIRDLAEASALGLQLEETMTEIQQGIAWLQDMIDPENN
jgi:phosphoglycolate phosphatase-like HAD superfamily hydrolase